MPPASNRTHVLLIDDDEDSFIIARDLLSLVRGAAIDLDWVNTFERGLAAIRGRKHHAYLIDYRLGQQDGIELMRLALGEGCRAPIIILTGQDEHAIEMQALSEGAADFLAKGQVNGEILERSIRYAIERSRVEDQRLYAETQLQMLTQQVPAILWTTDDQLQFTSSWGGGLQGLKLQPNEVVGLTLYQYFETDNEKHEAIQAHRRALDGESVSYYADWKGRKFRVLVNPLSVNSGHRLGAAGIALDITDAKQLEDEFNAAKRIQEGLLPKKAPNVAGLDVAGICRPAAATGGDYFDFIIMPDGSLGVVIADVSGHGFSSALITMETRRLLRTLIDWGAGLSDILAAANHALAEHPDNSRKFVTLFFACINPTTRMLTYCAAGHEAYLFGADGSIRKLQTPAFPLGIRDEAEFHCGVPVQLGPGELLLLLTDGIDEAHDFTGTNQFGKRRAFEVVKTHRHRSAQEIVQATIEEVRDFCHPGIPQDDLTMVLVKINEPTAILAG